MADTVAEVSALRNRQDHITARLNRLTAKEKLASVRNLNPAERRREVRDLRAEHAQLEQRANAMQERLNAAEAQRTSAPRAASAARGRSSGS